jgi:DNA replicative helicase MCM subunit Mcm2 (Cdc46/Mcm family)
MRDLDPQHIETLISLRGIVIRCSSVIPDMRVAVFRCTSRQRHSTESIISSSVSVKKKFVVKNTVVFFLLDNSSL